MSYSRFAVALAAIALSGALPGQTALPTAPAKKASSARKRGRPKDNPGDWPMYTRDLGGTRYSPLKQINTTNVSELHLAWSLRLAAPGSGGRGGRGGGGVEAAAAPQDGAAAAGGDRGGRGGRGAGGPTANAESTPIVVNDVMY